MKTCVFNSNHMTSVFNLNHANHASSQGSPKEAANENLCVQFKSCRMKGSVHVLPLLYQIKITSITVN